MSWHSFTSSRAGKLWPREAHLRQVGDAEDLRRRARVAGGRHAAQQARDRLAQAAAHPGVQLIQHHDLPAARRLYPPRACLRAAPPFELLLLPLSPSQRGGGLEGEHDARALAAGRNGAQWPQRLGGPRRQQELHRVQAAAPHPVRLPARLVRRRSHLLRHM